MVLSTGAKVKGPAQHSKRSASLLLQKLLKLLLLMKLLTAVVAVAGVSLADDVGQEALLSRSVPRAVGAASGCRLEQLWRTRSLTAPKTHQADGAASGCQLTQLRARPVARSAVVAVRADGTAASGRFARRP